MSVDAPPPPLLVAIRHESIVPVGGMGLLERRRGDPYIYDSVLCRVCRSAETTGMLKNGV